MDPPVKLWEKWYYSSHDGCEFRDFELTDSGSLFITGGTWDWTEPFLENYCAFLLDQDGNVLWEITKPFYGLAAYDGAILQDSSYIITGTSVVTPNDTYSLFIMKISQEGSIEWTKVYDYPDTKEEGYGITCLPDGGFAVCGRVNGTGSWAGEAWILRTDANGDTLWTESWGTSIENYGESILFNNGELVVLAKGEDDTLVTQGPHLLFYDLDGNYLRGTDYSELHWRLPADFCLASDGGYTFVTDVNCVIWHTDSYGETLWWYEIYVSPNDQHEGFCIRQTTDSGYIFSGWDGYWPGPRGNELPPTEEILERPLQPIREDYDDYKEGWLVRFDSEGNELWNINNIVSHDNFFYSCLQLPEGGYFAGGTWSGTGYLVKYAPETGIQEPEPEQQIGMDIYPNPFISTLTISLSSFEPMNASLTIYDLGGRVVDEVADEFFQAGNSTIEWTAPGNLSSGCYIMRLETSKDYITMRCVLLR